MAANFSVRIGEIGLFTFIRRPGNISLLIFTGLSKIIWLHRVNIQ